MKISKVLIIAAASLTLLTGCFNTDSGTASNATPPSDQTKVYNNNQFALSFPANWDVIQPNDFTSEIPRETQVVVRNNIKNDTFTANVNVVKNDLQTTLSNLDYAKEILNRQKTGLLDYKETKREIVKVSVGGSDQETYYVEFEARLNSTEPVTKFIQSFGVKDKAGFIVMAAYSQNESDTVVTALTNVVKSFRVD
jgi:hypothetical protein